MPYSEEGIPLAHRVARHLAAFEAVLRGLGDLEPEKAVAVDGLPPFAEVLEKGLGKFLRAAE